MPDRGSYDVVIVGAGFYGCALAAHLGDQGKRVLVCEAGAKPMERASAINQARVHTGFHYPRSYATALRSLHNHERFTDEYGRAIHRDFRMIYAVARYGTKVNAQRFVRMYEAMGAPIERASPAQRALFSSDLVEDAFACTEYAFDYTILRDDLLSRIRALPVEFAFATSVERVGRAPGGGIEAETDDGARIGAERVFNISYSNINTLAQRSGLGTVPLKHELVEIALVEPPEAIAGCAVTLMDGAFFSTMPYPSRALYSLTHVRYTPHYSWTEDAEPRDDPAIAERLPRVSRWRHMVNDASRYMPALKDAGWKSSLFEVKSVPIENERDDGRPILFHEPPELPGFASILGSKIDNIYDLFELLDGKAAA